MVEFSVAQDEREGERRGGDEAMPRWTEMDRVLADMVSRSL